MRISDNTSAAAVGDSLKTTRGKMERLQMQNASQKKLLAPSDDPAAHTKIMDIRTTATVNAQFENNAMLAKTRMQATDTALSDLYDLFVRAKEIALSQSSDASASADSRQGVAQEVNAMYSQLQSIANRREGQYYVFGGFKTLTQPYNNEGQYFGDTGEIPVEIQKDVFVPVNIPGPKVFEVRRYRQEDSHRTPEALDRPNQSVAIDSQRKPASESTEDASKSGKAKAAAPQEIINVFHELDQLRTGLLTNDTLTIRDTLDRFDDIIKNTIKIRTQLSSRVSGVDAMVGSSQRTDVSNAELMTQLEDADYAELWSKMAKEETVLRSSLHAAQKLIQPTLLEFLR